MKERKGVTSDLDLDANDLHELADQFKAEYKQQIGSDFPTDPKVQLFEAIKAVFRSWDNPRANIYRMDHDIPYSWGTAVNVQMMAFGNMGDDCGTGVAFTRSPATGSKGLFGEFLTNAQGEDVVAGVRTPMPISEMEQKFPEAFKQFVEVCKTLENHYHDMQDMEFTVEHGKLYMLQTRNGKRTAAAAIKIACDLIDEGMISEEEALMQIDAKSLDMPLHPQFDPAALKAAKPVGKAIAASPGAAAGKIVFTAEDAVEQGKLGEEGDSFASGLVSRRTSITFSPSLPCSTASSAVNTILPAAAPGLAAMALPTGFAAFSAAGSNCGCSSMSRIGVYLHQRFFFAYHAFVYQVAGNLYGGGSGTLAVTGLQHVKLAVLNGELHVLHVMIMIFKGLADFHELLERFGELLLHLAYGHGGAHAGNDVFALSIGQEFAEEALAAGSGAAGERDAGAAIVAHVAEGHHLHVNGSTPGIGNVVIHAVNVGAGVVPAAENGLDSLKQLHLRVGAGNRCRSAACIRP